MKLLPVNTTEFWKKRIVDSDKYGDIHHSVYISRMELWEEIEKAHRKILEPYKDKAVLDAGCGYGRCASWFSTYKGIDLSPDLLDIAIRNNPGKLFIEGDLANLPFEDKYFDMAFCISIKAMIEGNLGMEAWEKMERELTRVAEVVLLLEYENPHIYDILT